MALLLGVFSAISLLSLHSHAAAQEAEPTIELSPTTGLCDQLVDVSGSGFGSSAEVEVWVGYDGSDVRRNSIHVAAAPDGTFTANPNAFPGGCPRSVNGIDLAFVAFGPGPSGEVVRATAIYHITTSSLPATGLHDAPADRGIEVYGWLGGLVLAALGTVISLYAVRLRTSRVRGE